MSLAFQVDELQVRAGHNVLIDALSLSLKAGEALTLLGESGAGKSLLAQAIMGNLPSGLRASGQVRVGQHTSPAGEGAKRRPLWGRQIGLLPQEPWLALDPTMRVRDQVAETHALVTAVRWPEARTRAAHDLDAIGLAHARDHYPHQISGGMAQRVAFAAVHAGAAPLLIVDEPTKGLDAALRDDVVALLQQTLAEGGAVLTITHDVAVARALGGSIAVMQQGQIVEQGDAASVLNAPAHAYTRALLTAEPARWPDRPPTQIGQCLIQGRKLGKRFGHRLLFEQLDIHIHAGERLAIQGGSGSGKTTLGNILLGLIAPDHGEVLRAPGLPRQGLQKLYQDPAAAFAPRLSLGQALRDLIRLHRLDGRELGPLLTRLRLSPSLLERLPGQVSGGELQRIALARLLLLKPAVIFADEPTSRLDPLTQQQTLTLLADTAETHGCALVLVTHDPDIATRLTSTQLQMP